MPPPSRLEAAVRNLAASGRHRALITFVERWAAYADPPQMARIAQAEAFLELAQPDRAWIRLQPLANDSDASTQVLSLAARIFLARGWSSKAREYLQRALTDAGEDPRIQRLWDDAAAPVQELAELTDNDLKHADDPDTADAIVEAAAAHLGRGRQVLAKGALERVLQAQPEHERARDLLWGLSADTASADATLAQLTERYAPVQYALGDFVDENTESITSEALRELAEPDESGSHSFPSLFRGNSTSNSDEDQDDEQTDEITRAFDHEGPSRLKPMGDNTLPSDDGFDSLDGDTRIVRVRGKDGMPEPMHKQVDQPDAGFDLGAYRREMGVPMPPTFDTDLEEEDDDLVVLTGREKQTPAPLAAPTDPTQSQIGREVAHLMGGRRPRTPHPPITRPDPSADTPALATVPAAQDRNEPGTNDTDAAEHDDHDELIDGPPSRPVWPWIVVAAVTLFIAFAAAALLAVAVLLR